MRGKTGGKRPIIIKREEVVEVGHHGGAWKVAYADFVTAMMAFFLLMWLLNATTDAQRRGLADYFSPLNPLARGASGSGQPFGGKTPFETGDLVSDRGTVSVVIGSAIEQVVDEEIPETLMAHRLSVGKDMEGEGGGTGQPGAPNPGSKPLAADISASDPTLKISPDAQIMAMIGRKTLAAAAIRAKATADEAALTAELDRRERAAFAQVAQQIFDAVHGDKMLETIAQQLSIDMTPEGLRIQLLDEDRQPMFALGSTTMNERAKLLLQKVAPALLKLSEPIAIAGHTDATPFRNGDKGNWELSSERANVTRRILAEAGLPEARIRSVTGNADRDLLLPADPLAAANRRIAIVVLRTARK